MTRSPSSPSARPGHTLPVFACAAALAVLRRLQEPMDTPQTVLVDLLNPPHPAEITVNQLAPLPDGSVLAITHSDPGNNLDLTRHTPIWAIVAWSHRPQAEPILLEGGEGIGKLTSQEGQAAIYRYVRHRGKSSGSLWHHRRPHRSASRRLR